MPGRPVLCGDIMEQGAARLSRHARVREAAEAVLGEAVPGEGCPAIAVVDEDSGAALGVIRRKALLQALLDGARPHDPAASLIERAVARVAPDTAFSGELQQHDIVLVEHEGRLAGVIHPHARRAREALWDGSPIMAAVLSAIPTPIVGIDTRDTVRLCNDSMQRLFPQEAEGILGKKLTEMIEGSQLVNIVRTGQTEKWQKLLIGSRFFLVNRSPLIVDGRLVGALASMYDSSELEQVSSELKSVRMLMEELDGIIESSFDGIYVTDGAGRTLRVNESYERITGLRREEVIGFTMHELVARGVFDQSTSIGVLETGKPTTLIQKVNNGAVTVMASGKPLRDAAGNITRIVTTVRDLTELNRLRDELSAVGSLKSRYQEELRELKQQIGGQEDIVVYSPSMKGVLELALRLGSVDSTVLIQGESGTGKEIIAGLIHRHSLRQDKPFVKINCAAIPEPLLESELFGYVRGAFTGASREGKPGLFEAADGGTLLLDEVGDLPLALQVKLLRAIQERQIRRVGDTVPRNIDVRLLASTNQNLAGLVAQKLFREDLYYRLNVVPVNVPPLRERKEDVLFMVQCFLKKFCARHRRTKELHPSVMPVLLDYGWPGNVRELENIIERLVVTSVGSIITADDLPPALRAVRHDEHAARAIVLPLQGASMKEIVDNAEREVLRAALAQHKTTRKAAEALGIDQSSVVRKARKLGLNL